MRAELEAFIKKIEAMKLYLITNDRSKKMKLGRQENNECECEKVSYAWIWAILFLVVLFIAMVEW